MNHQGVNHATGLPAIDNKDLQIIIGTRVSSYMISTYRTQLPLMAILNIETDVGLCSTETYLCEDTTDLPQISDSALNAKLPPSVISPPKTVTFTGWCFGGFVTKLSRVQLQCINQHEVLRNWYQFSLARSIEDGKQSIVARFYRHLLTRAVHPENTGHAAGMMGDPQELGTASRPVLVSPETSHLWVNSMLNVVKQMPRAVPPENGEWGQSVEDAFFLAPAIVENTFRLSEYYNSYDRVGDCAGCHTTRQTFDRMPYGMLAITSYCNDKRVIETAGGTCIVYPVLFGRRYMGTKASLRIDTMNYESADKESVFFKTTFYWQVYTYDCRFLGISWITIRNPQPETVTCG